MEENKIQCYVSVNEEGDIIHAQFGENIIPSGDWDFFFWVGEYLEIENWKVVVEGMKPNLILKAEVTNP